MRTPSAVENPELASAAVEHARGLQRRLRWLAGWFLALAVVGGVAMPSIIEGEPILSLITVGLTVAFFVLFAGWPLLASFASARQAERADQRVAAGQAAN